MLNVKLGRANELAFPSVAESCFFTLPTSIHLSLNATISVTTSQALYLVSRYQVEVSRDSMLQSRSSYRKLKSLALSFLSKKTVDQTTRERVATTYAVDDRVDVVVLALIELLTIIDKSLRVKCRINGELCCGRRY